MKRFLRPRNLITALGLLAGLLGSAAPASAQQVQATISTFQNGAEPATPAIVRVAVNNTTGANAVVVFDIQTTNGTALNGSDFLGGIINVPGQVVPPGVTNIDVPIPVVDNALFEPTQDFTAAIANLQATDPGLLPLTTGGNGLSTTVLIADNDPAPVITINDVTANEGNAGTTNFVFQINVANATEAAYTINVSYADGTATEADNPPPGGTDNDYNPGSTTVINVPSGVTGFANVAVPVVGDLNFETDETFFVNLAVVGTTFNNGASDLQGLGTILNDDVRPTITIGNVTASEGNAGTTNFNFPITLSAASIEDIRFDALTLVGTGSSAEPGSDYVPLNANDILIPANTPANAVVPVTVQVNGDTTPEGNETFFVQIRNAENAVIGPDGDVGTGTINNDDVAPTISAGSVNVNEGTATANSVNVTVTLSSAQQVPVSVKYQSGGGTAVAGVDYVPVEGILTFLPGQTTQQIVVTTIPDATVEPNETLNITFSNASGIGGALPTPTVTIVNDDSVRNLSIGDVNIVEGNSGVTNAVFTVQLSGGSGPLSESFTVDYATADGTALGGQDYNPTTGTLTFAPGDTSQQIVVPIIGDLVAETQFETFTVTLSNISSADITLAAPTDLVATGTIQDNDVVPTLSVNSVAIQEGNSGSQNLAFTVTLSSALDVPVSVQYRTVDVTATGGVDYIPTSGGTITFQPGVLTQTINVPVLGDLIDEPNETFQLQLFNQTPSAIVAIGVANGTGTINDDDVLPTLTIADAQIVEGNSGSTNLVFTVTLSSAISQAFSIQYQTVDGTATGGVDYIPTSGGTITFQPGVTTQTISVPVLGDLIDEPNETFTVVLSNSSVPNTIVNVTDASAVGTILDDDGLPTLSINDVQIVEGNSGSKNLAFTVTLSSAISQAFSVQYRTNEPVGANPATGGLDFIPVAGGTITFQAGVTTQTINIPILGDLIDEFDETFDVELFNISVPGTIVNPIDTVGRGTILDDDNPPVVNISADQSLCEDEGPFTYTVSLSIASGKQITVPFTVLGTGVNPATPGVDFTVAPASPLIFAPGETQKTITVTINDDNVLEFNEQFTITLGQPNPPGLVNVLPGDLVAVGTIEDNDGVQVIEVENITEDGTTIDVNGLAQQCFRATAYNGCGERVAGAALLFDVEGTTGSNNADKVVITDPNGVAEFCYTPLFAGTDTITVSDTASGAIATPVVVQVVISLPAFSTPARVEGSGYINGANNTPASFSLNANVKRNGKATGNVTTDLFILGGLAKFRSTRVDRVIAGDATEGGHAAIIFGVGRVQGAGIVRFRVDVLDQVDPGVPGDRYVLTILNDATGDVASVGGALKHARGKGIKNDVKIDGPGL